MATPTLKLFGSSVTVIASGTAPGNATLANNVMTTTASSKITSTETLDYPLGEFELAVAFTTAPTALKTIDMYARDYDIANSNASPTPSTTQVHRYLGSFVVAAIGSSTVQYLKTEGVPLAKNFDIFILNNATGQTINASWTLKMRPYTLGT